MYYIKLYVAVIALVVFHDIVDGKKIKKNKKPKVENEDTTPQPNVISYSTFGFNDVGSYDGFVPSSPDYASFLSNTNQEATTRLYAPAFPTAMDSVGFNENYDSLAQGSDNQDGQLFNEDGAPQSSMLQYSPSQVNFFNTPNFETNDDQNKQTAANNIHGRITDELNAPVYGTKINSRNKNSLGNQYNNTEFNTFNKEYLNPSEDKYLNFHNVESTHENKPSHGESNFNYQNPQSYMATYPSVEYEDYKPAQVNMNSGFKFPKVIDFTKSKQYYPTGSDSNKFEIVTPKSLSAYNSMANVQSDAAYTNLFDDLNTKTINPTPTFKHTYDFNYNPDAPEKNLIKANTNHDFSYNYASPSHLKNTVTNTKSNIQHKKKIKNKLRTPSNYSSDDYKKWKDPFTSKGYEYSTNYSNTRFKYDVSEPKKPFNQNIDEIVPASSNIVDLSHYQFPEAGYSSFKNTPDNKFHDEDDYSSLSPYKDKYKANDFDNEYKNLFSTAPTTTSYWGNSFKTSEFTSHKKYPKKTQYSDDINEDVINIPKRPNKNNFGKPFENQPNSWFNPNQRPYKLFKPQNDWPQEVSSNRYKAEEDLLDLRNHDTSHPSYLPTYKLNNNGESEDNDFKKVVDKWRQSYLKSKYKNLPNRDYESYASDTKSYHVPIPKPFPIEIPHPVIIPVPQPYPVRVPVAKPVAVPVVTELKVPIEKPVPYPVIKKVPYPVEKLIPVRIEKEVQVPIEKPYPVPIPYVRPVFHHTRPSHEEYESHHVDDEGYRPRPDSNTKFAQYRKRPGSRNRTRRPSRNTYQERNRRRWPDKHRPTGFNKEQRFVRPPVSHQEYPYKYHNSEADVNDDERSDYFSYCRTTGNC